MIPTIAPTARENRSEAPLNKTKKNETEKPRINKKNFFIF